MGKPLRSSNRRERGAKPSSLVDEHAHSDDFDLREWKDHLSTCC